MESLQQASMHKKAAVVRRVLWAARSAAEHNYSLDPENLYIGTSLLLLYFIGCLIDFSFFFFNF